jgi:hypothetical protein
VRKQERQIEQLQQRVASLAVDLKHQQTANRILESEIGTSKDTFENERARGAAQAKEAEHLRLRLATKEVCV